MKTVTGYEEYQQLIAKARAGAKRLISNCCMLRPEVERCLSQKRLFYQKLQYGIAFLVEENGYYEANFYLNEANLEGIQRENKPIAAKLLYQEGHKPSELGQALRQAEFTYQDTLLHAKVNPEEAIVKYQKSCKRLEQRLLAEGFSFGPVSWQELRAVRAFLEQIEEIPYYQKHLLTQEEYKAAVAEQRFFQIVAPDGEVCAAQYFAGDDKAFYGLLGIHEKYRAVYGLIILLSMYGWEYAQARGMQEFGWIREDNQESIRYHVKTGWSRTGRKMDEWILEI